MSTIVCYNCDKKGHFARFCTEPKKVTSFSNASLYVTSCLMLIDSHPSWIVDSGATKHITRDRGAYVEFRRIPQGTRWIYVGNNSRVEVKGEGTCKLELRGGRTLLLHDVLYAPDIRRNLVFVRVLLELGYNLNFSGRTLTIYFGSEFYGSGYISSGFIILDIDYSQIQNNNSYSLIASSSNVLIDATV